MKLRALAVLTVVLASTSAFAQTPPTPTPSAHLKELAYFTGTWKCTGMTFASQMGPQHATMATVEASWGLGGFWLLTNFSESRSVANPHPYAFRGVWGWDEKENKVVWSAADDMGGYTTSSSAGWKGNALTMEGPMHAGKELMNGRDTFTKKSASQMVHTGEIEMNAKWVKLDEETCTKAGK